MPRQLGTGVAIIAVTIWVAVPLLAACIASPPYAADNAFVPEVLKTTLQLVAGRVIVQGASAPVMVTVPVGVVIPPVTETVTLTVCPRLDGSGVCAVIVVVVAGKFTVCAAVPLLGLWSPV